MMSTYAMPLRMSYALTRISFFITTHDRSISEIVNNKTINKECNYSNLIEHQDEFLSKMKKTDRLHSVLTICIYYGETPWDGPRSLIDMLEIPDAFKPLISDYKFNLIELRKSEHLKSL